MRFERTRAAALPTNGTCLPTNGRRNSGGRTAGERFSSMIPAVKAKLLEGKRGLIVGIANDQSIAWGCAKAFRAFGAELAVTYLNEKAKKYVEPLARAAPLLGAPRPRVGPIRSSQ